MIGFLAFVWIVGLTIAAIRNSSANSALRQRLDRLARDDERINALVQRIARLDAAVLELRGIEPAPSHPAPLSGVSPGFRQSGTDPSAPPPVAGVSPGLRQSGTDPVAPPPVSGISPDLRQSGTDPVAPPPVSGISPGSRQAGTDPSDESESTWELVFGANWLNRIGVVAIVIGIALGVGYTINHTGPLGRVAIGYAMSLAMLGAGVWLERNPTFRSYAYGLVAGGWAGTYFTAYAMHAVEGARVVESPIIGTAALVLVAAGMVAHSLRYKSQTVTGLAYLISYATLALTPLSGFALVASVPLSASLLFVTQRFGWAHVSTLGVIFTYGVFALRGKVFPDGFDAAALAPYLTLAVYWVTFEIADIASLRSGRPVAERAPLFVLNAIGFLGALLVQLPVDDTHRVSAVLAGVAAAYLANAAVRAKVVGRIEDAGGDGLAILAGRSQGAVGLAAALTIWSILLRFSGPREVIALLLTMEMLFVAGVFFGDRIIRTFAVLAAAVVGLRALALVTVNAPVIDWAWSMHAWVPAVSLVALVFYANRGTLRSRAIAPNVLEWGYAPVASILLLQVIAAEVPAPYLGLTLIAAALLLIEVGIRRSVEYRYQAHVVGLLGLGVIMERFFNSHDGVTSAEQVAEAWRVLPAAVTLVYAMAARLAWRARSESGVDDLRYGSLAFATVGSFLVALFEWCVGPPATLAPIWGGTALAFVILGASRRWPLFVWHGYALVLTAAVRAMGPIITVPPRTATPEAVLWAGVVIGLLFASGVIGRQSLSGRTGTAAESEDAVRLAVLAGASAGLVGLIFWEVDRSYITLALGVAGVLQVGAGLPLGERVLRLAGLGVFALGIVKLFVNDLVSLQGLTRIVSFTVSGVVLLAVSWVYTRFREQIRRYL